MNIQVMTNEKTKLSQKQKQTEENWNNKKAGLSSLDTFLMLLFQ